MERNELEGPPSKRRRFFTDPEENADQEPPSSPSTTLPFTPKKQVLQVSQDEDQATLPSSSLSVPTLSARSPLVERDVGHSVNQWTSLWAAADNPKPAGPAPLPFDQETFEAFVGEAVSPEILAVIRENCNNNIERAVNMYLDGTWKIFKKPMA